MHAYITYKIYVCFLNSILCMSSHLASLSSYAYYLQFPFLAQLYILEIYPWWNIELCLEHFNCCIIFVCMNLCVHFPPVNACHLQFFTKCCSVHSCTPPTLNTSLAGRLSSWPDCHQLSEMHVMLRPSATLTRTQIHSTLRMLSKKKKTVLAKKTEDNCLSYFIILNCGHDSLYKFCNHQWKPPFQHQCPGAYICQEGAWQEHGSPGGCAHLQSFWQRAKCACKCTLHRQYTIAPLLYSLTSTWHQLAFFLTSMMKAEQCLIVVLVCLSLMGRGHARPSQLVIGCLCFLLCDLPAHIPGLSFIR